MGEGEQQPHNCGQVDAELERLRLVVERLLALCDNAETSGYWARPGWVQTGLVRDVVEAKT